MKRQRQARQYSCFSAPPPCHSANCGNLVGWEELPYVLLSTFSYSHTVWCNKWQSVASLARNHLVNQAAACWSPGPTLPISPLKLSGPFINLGTNQKYAKAHHSLNSHISSSCIPPKLAAKKSWEMRGIFFANNRFIRSFGRQAKKLRTSAWCLAASMNYWGRGRHRCRRRTWLNL